MIRQPLRARCLIPITIVLSPLFALLTLRMSESQGNDLQKMIQAEMSNQCANCHKPFVEEWSSSRHAKAYSGLNYKKMTENLGGGRVLCDGCHSPGLIQFSGLGKQPTSREAKVPERGVMCVCCHADATGAMHGPYGGPTDFHKTVKDLSYQKSNATCVSCHGQTVGAGADYDQATPFAIYEQKAKGATCSDCHMNPVDRPASTEAGALKRQCASHAWPGAYDKNMLGSAAILDLKVAGTMATVTVENLTGHMMPGGAHRQAILMVVVNGTQVAKREVFTRKPGGSEDNRLKPGEKKPVTATIPAGAKVAAQLWWKPMPDTPDNQAVKMAEAGS